MSEHTVPTDPSEAPTSHVASPARIEPAQKPVAKRPPLRIACDCGND